MTEMNVDKENVQHLFQMDKILSYEIKKLFWLVYQMVRHGHIRHPQIHEHVSGHVKMDILGQKMQLVIGWIIVKLKNVDEHHELGLK